MTGRPSSASITQLLQAHRGGDREAFDRLVPLVYPELRRIAHRQLRGQRPGQTLITTALVNEAWCQMVDESSVEWQDRAHFFAITSRLMRRIVVDYIRRAVAQKRGGDAVHVQFEPEQLPGAGADAEQLLVLDQALDKLAAFRPRMAQIVECRFFAGLTEEETAEAIGGSLRTVQRDWMRARAWLHDALATGGGSGSGSATEPSR